MALPQAYTLKCKTIGAKDANDRQYVSFAAVGGDGMPAGHTFHICIDDVADHDLFVVGTNYTITLAAA